MQGRHRNPSDGIRSGYRNFNRGGFSRKSYLPPPPPRKEEILMEAGRLAAEYLVYKGLLPANSLPQKWPNNKFQEFKGQDRESLMPDGRTSALNRLGNSNSDVGHGRRRYNDDYNQMGSRNHFRGRKRMAPYNRGYGSDWGRENGRWMGRNRGYSDTMEGEDDFAPGYHKDRRSGFDVHPSRSEVTGESGSENHDIADDTGSKASSSSTRKEPPSDADVDLNKVVSDGGIIPNTETGDEVKSDTSGDSKKNGISEEDLDVQPFAVEGDSKNGDDLLKDCCFAKVPTKPRSSIAQRSPKMDQGLPTEACNTAEGSSGVPKVDVGEDHMGGFSSDSLTNQTKTPKCQAPDISNILSIQPVEETVDPQEEASQSPPGFWSSRPIVDVAEDINKREGIKRQRDPSPENEYSRLHNLRAKQSSPEVERLPMDEDIVAPVTVDQEKAVGDAFFPKLEPELNVKLEEEKQLLPTSFKICDLNLMQTPEITEIPDDPVLDHLRPSAPSLETGKELSMDFGLSIGNNNNGTADYSRLSGDDKVVPVIDLEDDSPIEANACDPSKPKDEPIYSSLDNFLTHTEHADLPGIQDGYSLAISEFLGTDISRCPSVPSDLSNLQTAMGLHDAEGVPNDDDSIYVSLGEIPIGFMEEVWDQPHQEYGKFF